MKTVSIRQIGNSKGVIFPQEIINKLKCKTGDMLYVLETSTGIELTPYNPEFAKDMQLAEDIMMKNKNMFKKLAQ